MSVATVIEITTTSSGSFQDAIEAGIGRSSKKVEEVRGARIKDREVVVTGGRIPDHRVRMTITFLLK